MHFDFFSVEARVFRWRKEKPVDKYLKNISENFGREEKKRKITRKKDFFKIDDQDDKYTLSATISFLLIVVRINKETL